MCAKHVDEASSGGHIQRACCRIEPQRVHARRSRYASDFCAVFGIKRKDGMAHRNVEAAFAGVQHECGGL
jgi:hypothetical protein